MTSRWMRRPESCCKVAAERHRGDLTLALKSYARDPHSYAAELGVDSAHGRAALARRRWAHLTRSGRTWPECDRCTAESTGPPIR